jgi:hypothetical protein
MKERKGINAGGKRRRKEKEKDEVSLAFSPLFLFSPQLACTTARD